MFSKIETPIPGLFVLQPRIFKDNRGDFIKTYHTGLFQEAGLNFTPKEEFFSVSARGVLRGMHFQIPPFAHSKLVYSVTGRVLDVLLDLRRTSPTYGQTYSRELSATNRELLFIPEGIAHGFLTLEDASTMIYLTSVVHAPNHDTGILWNSFGFRWPTETPIISAKDANLPAWAKFESPFA